MDSSSGDDGLFGPQLPGRFDFTLAFEHSILSIPPSLVFLLAASFKLHHFLSRSHPIALYTAAI